MHLLLISSQIFFSFLFFAKQNATPVHNYNLYTQKYKSNKQVLHFTLQLRQKNYIMRNEKRLPHPHKWMREFLLLEN